MRWVWFLASGLLLAACERTGIEIVVYPPADPAVTVDEIRLFLGVGAGAPGPITTPGVSPTSMLPAAMDGTYWPRDVNNELDVMTLMPGATTPAHFVYPGGDGTSVTAIAVGYLKGVANSTIAKFDVTLSTDTFAVYRIGLNPARDAVMNRFALNQVQLWGPQTVKGMPDQTCVRAENYRGDVDANYQRVAYIVSHDDPDCDGFLNNTPEECQNTVYMGKKTPTKDSLDCVTTAPLLTTSGTPATACILGGERCEDGKPAKRVACSASLPFCAPKSLCDECGNDFECAITPLAHHIDDQTHVACSIHYTDLGNGKIQLCPEPLDVNQLGPTAIEPCVGTPVFRGQGSGPASATGVDRWASRWVDGMASLSFLPLAMPACAFSIQPQGIVSASVFPIAGLVAQKIPSVRGDHGLILPIKIDLEQGQCTVGTRTTCQVVNTRPDDTIAECVQRIVPGP